MSKRDVQRREPALASRQAEHCGQNDHRVEPRKLMNALRKIICQKEFFLRIPKPTLSEGKQYISGCHISDTLTVRGRHYMAEGAWTTEFDKKLPLRPVKGQYLIVKDCLNC